MVAAFDLGDLGDDASDVRSLQIVRADDCERFDV